jgi:hypothetical protein
MPKVRRGERFGSSLGGLRPFEELDPADLDERNIG